jgi:hypothetical protein
MYSITLESPLALLHSHVHSIALLVHENLKFTLCLKQNKLANTKVKTHFHRSR